jgi:tight adherence protein B
MPGALGFVVIAVVAVIVLAAGQGIYSLLLSRQDRDADRLQRRLGNMEQEEDESLFREAARDAAAVALGGFGRHFKDILTESESSLTVSALLARMAGLAVVVGLAMVFLVGPPAVIVGPLVSLLPYGYYRFHANKRNNRMLEQLPDALDLMARSLQAGLGLSDAIKMAAEEMPSPLSHEFARVFEEVRFGRDYRDALGSMLERNPRVFELRMFVSSILLQRETGGNLIEILTTIANTIRNRFLFRAKVRALTSEAKFFAMIFGGLPLVVGTLITVVNPGYLSVLITDPLGNIFLGYFICSYSLGTFIMYNLSNVKV